MPIRFRAALERALDDVARSLGLAVQLTGRGFLMNLHAVRGPIHNPGDSHDENDAAKQLLFLDMSSRVIPKSSIVLGLLMLATLFLGRVSIYFQGVAFDESMLAPLIVVPLALAFAICFLITAVRTFIRVVKREVHVSWLGGLGCVLLLTYLSFEIPLPTFVDGLAVTLQEQVDEPLLRDFAATVRESNVDDVGDVPGEFSPLLALSDAEVAIRISDDAVYLSWGGEPRGTWGIAIAEQDGFAFPADFVPAQHTRQVYDKVWVYKTR